MVDEGRGDMPLILLCIHVCGAKGFYSSAKQSQNKRMKHTWLLLARFGNNEDQSCSCSLYPSISRRPFPHGASCVKRANFVLLSYFNYNLDSSSVFRLRTSIYRPYSQSMDNVHVALASPWTLYTPQRTSGDAQSSRVNYGLLVLDAAWQGASVYAEGDTGVCIQ